MDLIQCSGKILTRSEIIHHAEFGAKCSIDCRQSLICYWLWDYRQGPLDASVFWHDFDYIKSAVIHHTDYGAKHSIYCRQSLIWHWPWD